jgi:hypothetical protein
MKEMIHVTGSTCSGSSVVASVIGGAAEVAGIGEDHVGIDHYMRSKLNEANRLAWDSTSDFEGHEYHLSRVVALVEGICCLESMRDKTHMVFRRSVIQQGGYGLGVADFMSAFPGSRLVVCYRDPRMCAWSAFRRGLGKGLRHCCVTQAEQLTSMVAQLAVIPEESYMVVSYDRICRSPKFEMQSIADFCGIGYESMLGGMGRFRISKGNENSWYEEADGKDRDRIVGFFNRRSSAWGILVEKSL